MARTEPGLSGYSGYSGFSGYSGDNPGSSGYSGFSGYSGQNGQGYTERGEFVGSATIEQNLQDGLSDLGSTWIRGQSFTTVDAIDVVSITTYFGIFSTFTLTCDIYATDGSGLPTGSSLGSTTAADAATVTFTFGSPVSLGAGTKYCFVISSDGPATDSNSVYIKVSDVYAGGNLIYSLDSGSSWNNTATHDMQFIVTPVAGSYSPYDVVTYLGSSYVNILASTTELPTNTTYWTLMASIGSSGYSGYSGTSGFSGYSGDNPGSSGYSGFSGISGYSGYSGISGFSGATGTTGTSGFSGISGFSGYSGISGFSGYSGFSGISGFSGVGTSGFSGFSGYSGAGATLTWGTSITGTSGTGLTLAVGNSASASTFGQAITVGTTQTNSVTGLSIITHTAGSSSVRHAGLFIQCLYGDTVSTGGAVINCFSSATQSIATTRSVYIGENFNTNSAFSIANLRIKNEANAGAGANTGISVENASTELTISSDNSGAGIRVNQAGAGGTAIAVYGSSNVNSNTNCLVNCTLGNSQTGASTVQKIDLGTSAQGHTGLLVNMTNASTSATAFSATLSTTGTGTVFKATSSALGGGETFQSLIHTASGTLTACSVDKSTIQSSRTYTLTSGSVTDAYNVQYLKRTSVTTGAGGTLLAQGSVLKLENVATQTAGTLTDSCPLLSLIQSNTSTGGHILFTAYSGTPTVNNTLWYDGTNLKYIDNAGVTKTVTVT